MKWNVRNLECYFISNIRNYIEEDEINAIDKLKGKCVTNIFIKHNTIHGDCSEAIIIETHQNHLIRQNYVIYPLMYKFITLECEEEDYCRVHIIGKLRDVERFNSKVMKKFVGDKGSILFTEFEEIKGVVESISYSMSPNNQSMLLYINIGGKDHVIEWFFKEPIPNDLEKYTILKLHDYETELTNIRN